MSTKKTRWIFGTTKPRRVQLTHGGEVPGRWGDDGQWFEPKKIPPQNVTFNEFSGTAIVFDKRIVELIKGHSQFRSKSNPSGNIWLVSEDVVVEGPVEAVTAPPPPPKTRTKTISGARGTGGAPRAKGRANLKPPDVGK